MDKQAIDKQAIDKQAIDKQAIDKQAIDKQAIKKIYLSPRGCDLCRKIEILSDTKLYGIKIKVCKACLVKHPPEKVIFKDLYTIEEWSSEEASSE